MNINLKIDNQFLGCCINNTHVIPVNAPYIIPAMIPVMISYTIGASKATIKKKLIFFSE